MRTSVTNHTDFFSFKIVVLFSAQNKRFQCVIFHKHVCIVVLCSCFAFITRPCLCSDHLTGLFLSDPPHSVFTPYVHRDTAHTPLNLDFLHEKEKSHSSSSFPLCSPRPPFRLFLHLIPPFIFTFSDI